MQKKQSDSKIYSSIQKKSVHTPSVKQWYEANAESVVEEYESMEFHQLHSQFLKHLPQKPCTVLDVGAGSGRDAAAMADLGHTVVAVEPSYQMRKRASELHRQPNIHWLNDQLPKLKGVIRKGVQYDVIFLSAVWMHLAPSERNNAFRRIVNLLKPGGIIYITLRHGPFERTSGFYDIPDSDVLSLATDHGLFQIDTAKEKDLRGRPGVKWTRMIFRSPGDGTGTLPLLRGIILNDSKSSTYKLGLLKVLKHIAQSASGLAIIEDDERVVIPLGLFALYWLRVYRPLLDENLPQAPSNTKGTDRLGFAKEAYKHLGHISPHDLRVGMKFSQHDSRLLYSALKDICQTLVKMPMTYTTYSDGNEKVFKANPFNLRWNLSMTTIDRVYLTSFGEVELSFDLWQAVHQYGTWIEPAIVAEWKTLMQGYLDRQGRGNANAVNFDSTLHLQESGRETTDSRQRALELIDSGDFRNCVWSGKKLNLKNFDIDHCFPYSAWPCGDLWNLLPAARNVNQKLKREKLPRVELLQQSEDIILNWWEKAYVEKSDSWKKRFFDQAATSLRISEEAKRLEDVFSSLVFQQHQLRTNQQIPLWDHQF